MPDRIPLFPLGAVLFPGQPLPLQIFEPRYRLMLRRCLAESGRFGVVLIREGWEVGEAAVPCAVGTVARIVRADALPDGRSNIVALGERRFRVGELDRSEPYLGASVEWLDDPIGELDSAPEATRAALNVLAAFARALHADLDAAMIDRLADDPLRASYAVAAAFQGDLGDRQRLLEIPTAVGRLREATRLFRRDLALMQAGIPPHALRPAKPGLN